MRTIIKRIAKYLPSETINVPDPVTGVKLPYLTRYYLFGRDFALGNIYIHQFHSSDRDEELHNHPWSWGLSFIVSGGYTEQIKKNNHIIYKEREPYQFNLIRRNDFHRVFLKEKDCWTIFLAGKRVKSWGFWNSKTNKFRDWTTSPHSLS